MSTIHQSIDELERRLELSKLHALQILDYVIKTTANPFNNYWHHSDIILKTIDPKVDYGNKEIRQAEIQRLSQKYYDETGRLR